MGKIAETEKNLIYTYIYTTINILYTIIKKSYNIYNIILFHRLSPRKKKNLVSNRSIL
jgi:hypothetical protein